MNELIRTKETAVWLVLMALSLMSWLLGSNHDLLFTSPGPGIAALLFLAFFKVRLVLNYFMEVRHAPVELRWACEAWVLISWLGITAASIGALA